MGNTTQVCTFFAQERGIEDPKMARHDLLYKQKIQLGVGGGCNFRNTPLDPPMCIHEHVYMLQNGSS